MIQLPEGLLEGHFDRQLARGRLIRFRANRDTLSHGNLTERFKYGLVLNTDCSESTTLLAFRISRLAYYDRNPQFAGNVLRFAVGSYAAFSIDTILNLREVLSTEREKLRAQILSGDLKFEGELSAPDLARVDTILAASRLIALRLKQRTVPGAVR